jgi:hypothetical protein
LYLPFCIPLEVCFYLQIQRFLRERSRVRNGMFLHHVDPLVAERCWQSVCAEASPEALALNIRGWFLGSRELEPCEQDVLELISLTVFNASPPDLREAQVRRARRILSLVETNVGRRFPPGHEPGLRCTAKFAIEPLEPCWKPLLFYLGLQTVHGLVALWLVALGFEQREVHGLKFWHRPATPAAARAATPPLVFLHGVGGMPAYWLLLLIASRKHRGDFFVPIFPHCSLCSLPVLASAPRALKPDELAAAICAMLATACGATADGSTQPPIPRAAFLAHSLGTATLAALLKCAPHIAAAATFADLICFWFSGSLVQLHVRPPAAGRRRKRRVRGGRTIEGELGRGVDAPGAAQDGDRGAHNPGRLPPPLLVEPHVGAA